MKFSSREKKLIQLVKETKISPSHDFDHLKSVASFSLQLQEVHGGDKDVLVAASLLHDISRADSKFRGKESAKRAAELSNDLLEKANYNAGEIKKVTRAIKEHDQPGFHSKKIESKILKDADFLDGFGARSVLRSVMYAGETGESVREAIERVGVKGKKRLGGLEFTESKRLGWKLHRFSELFLAELERNDAIKDSAYSGKLIVLEGISGSGKNTQAGLLGRYLNKKRIKNSVVHHPTDLLKRLWKSWRSEVDDRASEAFLMLADRVRMVSDEILPKLNKGEVLISTRSSISAQVYQQNGDFSDAFYRLAFSFEPVPDLLIYLDLSTKEALKRADKRVRQGKEKSRGFFGKQQGVQRERYSEVLKHYPNVTAVDALGSKEEVHGRVVACFEKTISIR